MFQRLLPQRIDNHFEGHRLSLWLFGIIIVVKCFQSFNVMFNTYKIAIDADGIPLPTFSADASATIVGMFALLGFAQLFIWLLGLLALIRYRSMVPLMYAVMVLHYAGGRLLLLLHPITRVGSPIGVYVNVVVFVVMILGLALSLRTTKAHIAQTAS